MQNTKYSVILLVLLMLAGISNLSTTFSLLTSNNVIIRSTGQITTTYVTARSGSPQDIQAAVDAVAAAGGGTVYVPAGDWVFNIPSGKYDTSGVPSGVVFGGGISIMGAGVNQTILRMTTVPPGSAAMFSCDGRDNNKPVRISNIYFSGCVQTLADDNKDITAIILLGVTDYRVDHCKFTDFPGCAIAPENYREPYGANRGVIDHCIIDNPYREKFPDSVWGYGIIVWGRTTDSNKIWPSIDTLLGKYDGLIDVCYIEDNVFSRCRHSISSTGGGWYVARYNIFKDYVPTYQNYGAMVDVHGGSGANYGGRGAEVYNNTFYEISSDIGMAIDYRGGGGVIFNNAVYYGYYGIKLSVEYDYNPEAMVKDLWIWNTFGSPWMHSVTYELYKASVYQENVHYYLYAKSGYTPYPYPHPLILQTAP